MKRKDFLGQSSLAVTGILIAPSLVDSNKINKPLNTSKKHFSYAISTWNVPQANKIAGEALDNGTNALDAAVKGVAYEEANVLNTTVGRGGTPDRDGSVTLDACVMNHKGDCGSVLAVEDITHVASLAKKVMEKTPHVILAGEGARTFAISQGYLPENLLSAEGDKAWRKWLENGTERSNSTMVRKVKRRKDTTAFAHDHTTQTTLSRCIASPLESARSRMSSTSTLLIRTASARNTSWSSAF